MPDQGVRQTAMDNALLFPYAPLPLTPHVHLMSSAACCSPSGHNTGLWTHRPWRVDNFVTHIAYEKGSVAKGRGAECATQTVSNATRGDRYCRL